MIQQVTGALPVMQAAPSERSEGQAGNMPKAAGPAAADPEAASDLTVRQAPRSGRMVYEFRDPETGEITRQFPSEASLMIGALYDENA